MRHPLDILLPARVKSRIASHFESELDREAELTEAAQDFEARFMRVLDVLEELRGISGTLIAESESALSLGRSDDNLAHCMERHLTPYLAFIDESSERIQSIRDALLDDIRHIDASLKLEADLNRTFSLLTYIRTLFGIESAGLDPSAKTMFTALVEEINRLQTDVMDIFKVKFQALREHKSTLLELSKELDHQAREQFASNTDKRRLLEELLACQKLEVASMTDANAHLHSNSHKIGRSIEKAIVALQAQDIIAQKIQHVFKISEEMRNTFASLQTSSTKAQRCEAYRFIENASKVVRNLTQFILSELTDAEDVIRSTFGDITASIQEIEVVYERHRRRDTSHCPQNVLSETLRETEAMIEHCQEVSQHTFERIEPIRGMASNVTEIIASLSIQLHLIGLNAEVHAAHVGGRCGLEILSSKTSALSLETRKFCEHVSQTLDGLVGNLNENVVAAESLLIESQTKRDEIHRLRPTLSAGQQQFIAAFQDSQENATQYLERLSKLIVSQNNLLDLKRSLSDELSNLEASQHTISELAQKEADHLKVRIDIPTLMHGLLENYTMTSEKSIHLQSIGMDATHLRSASNPIYEDDTLYFEQAASQRFDAPSFASESPEPQPKGHVTTPGEIEMF